jgi:rod shape-determining protein MreC
MAIETGPEPQFWRTIRRIFAVLLCGMLFGLFLLWRIDNPRAERMRMAVIDRVAPALAWTGVPVTAATRLVDEFQSFTRVLEQNQELRRELQRMRGWREAALQLEQQNAQLRALNNVRLSPRLSFVTGEMITDSGSPFSQSGLVNVGRQDGVADGSAVLDGLGVVGRVAGLGEQSARIIFLTDVSSQVPVIVLPSGQRGILAGDNSPVLLLNYIEFPDAVAAGDRVVTSGDGGVFPADLLIGQVALDPGGRMVVRPSADYSRLDFVRVLRAGKEGPPIAPGDLVGERRDPPRHAPDQEKV